MIAVYAAFDSPSKKADAAVILHRLSVDEDAWGWLIHDFDEKGDHNPLIIKIDLEGSNIDALVSAIQELGSAIGAKQITENFQPIYPRAA